MKAQLLISPSTHEIAAELSEEGKVVIYEGRMLSRLTFNGIAVPKGFVDDIRKHYIYPTDDPYLFARAFQEEYFRHGLMQGGYYWIKKEDYCGHYGEINKAIMNVFKAMNLRTS